MATKKEEEVAAEAKLAPEGFVRVVVADGQMVRDAERKVLVRAGGVVSVPAHQYVESMGELEGAEEEPKSRKGRKAKADEGEGVSDV